MSLYTEEPVNKIQNLKRMLGQWAFIIPPVAVIKGLVILFGISDPPGDWILYGVQLSSGTFLFLSCCLFLENRGLGPLASLCFGFLTYFFLGFAAVLIAVFNSVETTHSYGFTLSLLVAHLPILLTLLYEYSGVTWGEYDYDTFQNDISGGGDVEDD